MRSADCPKEGGQSSQKMYVNNREDSEGNWAVKLRVQKYRRCVCSFTMRSCRNWCRFSGSYRADGLRIGGSSVCINSEQAGSLPQDWVVSAGWGFWFCKFCCNEIMVVKPYSDNISDLDLPLYKIPKFTFVWDVLVQWLIRVSCPVSVSCATCQKSE